MSAHGEVQGFDALAPVRGDMRNSLMAEGCKVVPSRWVDTTKNVHEAGKPDDGAKIAPDVSTPLPR